MKMEIEVDPKRRLTLNALEGAILKKIFFQNWCLRRTYCDFGGVRRFRQSESVVVRFEVFTAVTMKNVVFWDIKTRFIPHRRHITLMLQSSAG
jgi:hypothetical protein